MEYVNSLAKLRNVGMILWTALCARFGEPNWPVMGAVTQSVGKMRIEQARNPIDNVLLRVSHQKMTGNVTLPATSTSATLMVSTAFLTALVK